MREKNTPKYPYFTNYGLTITVLSKEWCSNLIARAPTELNRWNEKRCAGLMESFPMIFSGNFNFHNYVKKLLSLPHLVRT